MMARSLLSLALTSLLSETAAFHIDTHHHAVPPAYKAALEDVGGDGTGFTTPEWSIEATIDSLNAANSSLGIISVTTPGPPILGHGEEGRALARDINEFLGNETSGDNESRLGFFGSLPDWQDVDGVLAELDFLYVEQRLAHGVAVSSDYGGKLLGDPVFEPIWTRLNELKALVFLHPAALPGVQPEFISGGLPTPIVDFPLATTRAAVDIVFTGTLRRCPDVDVILSHAGGTLPYVGSRAISSLLIPEVGDTAQVTRDEAQEDFARYYHDIALSTSAAQLDGLLHFTDASKILFGTDFPYAPQSGITALMAQWAAFVNTQPRGDQISKEVLRENALTLLKAHEQGHEICDQGPLVDA